MPIPNIFAHHWLRTKRKWWEEKSFCLTISTSTCSRVMPPKAQTFGKIEVQDL